MNTVTRFEELEAWKRARELVGMVYAVTRGAEIVRDFGLTDQIRRASTSIMSNLAEGFERTHVQEKLQYYNIARASAGEVRSLSYVIEDNYPDHRSAAENLRNDVVKVGQLTTGLIRSTEARKTPGPLRTLLSLFL
jgi:four helix bundle protein